MSSMLEMKIFLIEHRLNFRNRKAFLLLLQLNRNIDIEIFSFTVCTSYLITEAGLGKWNDFYFNAHSTSIPINTFQHVQRTRGST